MAEYIRKLRTAFGIASTCLVASAVIQGAVLFPSTLATLSTPQRCRITSFACTKDRRAIVSFVVEPTLETVPPQRMFGIYDLAAYPPRINAFVPEVTPHLTACAKNIGRYFICTPEAELYSLDVTTRPHELSRLQIQCPAYPHLLECTDDGSTVVMASGSSLFAWRNENLIWQRSELPICCGHFVPGTNRFVCGLNSGEVIELDPISGETARWFASHESSVKDFSISPCGRYLASIDSRGDLTVSDFRSGQVHWSESCRVSRELPKRPFPHGGPQFTPDGDSLIVPYAHFDPLLLVVHRASDGEPLLRLRGDCDYTKGLAIDENRIVYAWCVSGNIMAWRIDTGRMIHRSSPARDLVRQPTGLGRFLLGKL